MMGKENNYFIKEGYEVRVDNAVFDDTPFTDEFQREVYQFARKMADENGCKSILDVGCGSGYKLVVNFPRSEFVTAGLELPDTVEWLRAKYPDHSWMVSDFAIPLSGFDLVICADVIEHLPEPDFLLRYIQSIAPRWIVLSTPDRDVLGAKYGTMNGPPKNIHHVREWNMTEFRSYIGSFFDIADHMFVSEENGTQLVLCRPRKHYGEPAPRRGQAPQ